MTLPGGEQKFSFIVSILHNELAHDYECFSSWSACRLLQTSWLGWWSANMKCFSLSLSRLLYLTEWSPFGSLIILFILCCIIFQVREGMQSRQMMILCSGQASSHCIWHSFAIIITLIMIIIHSSDEWYSFSSLLLWLTECFTKWLSWWFC